MHPPERLQRSRPRRWLRAAAWLFLLFLAMNLGLSGLLNTERIKRTLTARLEATFGRPVEVSHYRVSLLGQPRLEARYITVGEDSRFGNEFFLRAERLTASLRWRSLFRGRFEFGTLSLLRPSLNLVRLAGGEWNLESWLPAPGAAPPGGPHREEGRIYRVEVDGGRVNFKRGPDKHPFALVEVDGAVEQESGGRWRLDLEARLMRAGVAVQESGTVRVRGRMGGTAERLRPADLTLEWTGASLADVLRLAQGQDFGVRGAVSVEMSARSGAPAAEQGAAADRADGAWWFRGLARMRDIHRWDLPTRPNHPALNLLVEAVWHPREARIELGRGVLEAPGSNLRASGFLTWAAAQQPAKKARHFGLRLTSGGIALNDLLAWYRAFRPGVEDRLVLEGNAGVDLSLAGWPLRVEQGVVAAEGARLRMPGPVAPLAAGRALVRHEHGSFVLAPVTLTLAPAAEPPRPAEGFRLEGRVATAREGRFELRLSGQSSHAQDIAAAAAALGWTGLAGWEIRGTAGADLRWQGTVFPPATQAAGSVELRNLNGRPPGMNRPVVVSSARIEFARGERRATVAAAQAFGARWSGTAVFKNPAEPWEFVLAAERVDVAELAGWFAPGERGGLLARLGPERAAAPAEPGGLLARGRITTPQLLLRPLTLRDVQAQVELETGWPWRLRLHDARAALAGGRVAGWFRAESSDDAPSYRFEGRFERVNLAALTAGTATLAGRFAGSASGELELAARGRGRTSLVDSLEGRGKLEIVGAEMRGLDLLATLRNASRSQVPARAGNSSFRNVTGVFRMASRRIEVERLDLVAPAAELQAAGGIGFDRELDLEVTALAPRLASRSAPAGADPTGPAVRLTGPLAAPQAAAIAVTAGPVPQPQKNSPPAQRR